MKFVHISLFIAASSAEEPFCEEHCFLKEDLGTGAVFMDNIEGNVVENVEGGPGFDKQKDITIKVGKPKENEKDSDDSESKSDDDKESKSDDSESKSEDSEDDKESKIDEKESGVG